MSKETRRDCERCLGTGMGQVRIENSKCSDCKGRGFFMERFNDFTAEPNKQDTTEEHECDFSDDVDNDICPDCKEHTGFCTECGATECCG